MDSNAIVGLVVSALIVLCGLFISLATPLIKLNKTIQKLNDSIDNLNADTKEINIIVSKMKEQLIQHNRWLLMDKKRLDNQGDRLHKLDGEIGFRDNEQRM